MYSCGLLLKCPSLRLPHATCPAPAKLVPAGAQFARLFPPPPPHAEDTKAAPAGSGNMVMVAVIPPHPSKKKRLHMDMVAVIPPRPPTLQKETPPRVRWGVSPQTSYACDWPLKRACIFGRVYMQCADTRRVFLSNLQGFRIGGHDKPVVRMPSSNTPRDPRPWESVFCWGGREGYVIA